MQFTSDNTEGYTAEQLAELNRRFEAAWAAEGEVPEGVRKSHQDHVAAEVLLAFEQEADAAFDAAADAMYPGLVGAR